MWDLCCGLWLPLHTVVQVASAHTEHCDPPWFFILPLLATLNLLYQQMKSAVNTIYWFNCCNRLWKNQKLSLFNMTNQKSLVTNDKEQFFRLSAAGFRGENSLLESTCILFHGSPELFTFTTELCFSCHQGKKDFTLIFSNLMRRKIGTRSPTVEYLCTQEQILQLLIKG